MYRPTDPQQNLFDASTDLHPSAQRKLEKSWAKPFKSQIIPLLFEVEDAFAGLYHASTGRPVWSVARMLGLLLIQELLNATDRALEDMLAFDARVAYALGLTRDEAYLSRRSLLDFRARLAQHDPQGELLRRVFDLVTEKALQDLGVSTEQQRVDSTQIISNIRVKGQNALFAKALRHFIEQLLKEMAGEAERLSSELRSWASKEEESWFGKGGSRTKLETLAQWAVELKVLFAEHEAIGQWERYQLVCRLVEDYCEVDGGEAPEDDTAAIALDAQAAREAKRKERRKARKKRSKKPRRKLKKSSRATTRTDSEEPSSKCSVAPEQDDEDPEPEPVGGTGSPQSGPGPESGGQEPVASAGAPSNLPQCTGVLRKGRRGGRSLQSIFDTDASYGHKGVGYGVQITETCHNEGTELITDFGLQDAADNDWGKASSVVERLQERGRAPRELYADAGYPTAKSLHELAQQGIALQAPLAQKFRTDEFVGRSAFEFSDDGTVCRCPEGHSPTRHRVGRLPGCTVPELHAYFAGALCRECPLRGRCPARGKKTGDWWLRIAPRLRTRDEVAARQRETEWWEAYSIRSGVEATMSELKRAHGLGRLPTRGRVRVLQRVSLKVSACNIKRWLRAASAAKPQHPASPQIASVTPHVPPVGHCKAHLRPWRQFHRPLVMLEQRRRPLVLSAC